MFFDELKINDEFVSPSRTITDAHYLFFAGLTGDNHPSHYDVEFCRKTRFGKPVAHGLLLSLHDGPRRILHQQQTGRIYFP